MRATCVKKARSLDSPAPLMSSRRHDAVVRPTAQLLPFLRDSLVLTDLRVRSPEKPVILELEGDVRTFHEVARSVADYVDAVAGPIIERKRQYDIALYGEPSDASAPTYGAGLPGRVIGAAVAGIASSISAAAAWTTTPYPTVTEVEVDTVSAVLRWRRQAAELIAEKWERAAALRADQLGRLPCWRRVAQACCRTAETMPCVWEMSQFPDDRRVHSDLHWMVERTLEKGAIGSSGLAARLTILSALLVPALAARVAVNKYDLALDPSS
jgi:hypothetical protein